MTMDFRHGCLILHHNQYVAGGIIGLFILQDHGEISTRIHSSPTKMLWCFRGLCSISSKMWSLPLTSSVTPRRLYQFLKISRNCSWRQ
ncbi:hypothetical protein FOQG_18099 [Fusarium oxysporum f. sp. raphani 54005]|uniref:Uncharacterized protein n=1 Tax=Fusarium oxysporum f. sp. raphani 54005 TaxID=1089458 RepID=X0B616_FUSOX|nr:hypothetical protein FOQG_18099 [Fusarium oxysporum f. sp. raphani 54005]